MTDVSNRKRNSDGTFADENHYATPSTGSVPMPYDYEPSEDIQDLANLHDILGEDKASRTRPVEFSLPDGTTVNGWGLDDDTIPTRGLPEGWHAYHVAQYEDETQPDEDLMRAQGLEWDDIDELDPEDIEYKQVLVLNDNHPEAHRMDFFTTQNLDQRLADQPTVPDDDHWAFTSDADLDSTVRINGIDPDMHRDEYREQTLDRVLDDTENAEKTPERIDALAMADGTRPTDTDKLWARRAEIISRLRDDPDAEPATVNTIAAAFRN